MPEDRTADRTAPTPPTDDAATPALAPSAGGFSSWLPLIVTVVLMPILAFGMTQFILLPRLQVGLGIKAPTTSTANAKSKKDTTNEKMESVAVPKILVNVAGTMGARYLLVDLSVAGTGTDFKEKMQEHDAQLRDVAGGVLSAKTLADLEKPGERNLIRNELLSGFNNILGDSVVKQIYLTSFAIQ